MKQRIEACVYWHGQSTAKRMEVVEFNLFAQSCTLAPILSSKDLFAKRPPLAIYFIVVDDSRGYGFHCH
ncbi:hypothetical protein SORBI_3005G045250 [Sorghum bicolor]|jgi:hypothetical protein|uniref:Uncharacterized protein n=1 Tax=Sorghum bicolor TaxID=4558 RepID=A0A1Z5RGQ1_SORBI|nr:hypothetical protein SORBI_3005G045250 [Sorghum bicolor]